MSNLHLLDPLVNGQGSTNENRLLFLDVISWIIDLDPKGLSVSGCHPHLVSSAGAAFAIKGLVSCLRMPGREALQLRTRAVQLLPGVLLGLTAPGTQPSPPTPPSTPWSATLLTQVTEAVQWIADEYWSTASKVLPRLEGDGLVSLFFVVP